MDIFKSLSSNYKASPNPSKGGEYANNFKIST